MSNRWVICEPRTLSVTRIYEGENVVTGGPSGQAWIGTFASYELAEALVRTLKEENLAAYGLEPVKRRRRKPH